MKLTIVTGANSKYFNGVTNLLWSIQTFAPNANVIVYDLGLTDEQSKTIPNIRKFDFTKYPDYFNVNINSGRAAFRPIIMQSIAKEFGGVVMWLDAGSIVARNPIDIINYTIKNGVYCAPIGGTVNEGLHPNAIAPLNATNALLQEVMRDEGVTAFDTDNPKAMALLDAWAGAALNKDITAPEGSAKYSHRQDAVFTVLLKQHGFGVDSYRSNAILVKQNGISLKVAQYLYGKKVYAFVPPFKPVKSYVRRKAS